MTLRPTPRSVGPSHSHLAGPCRSSSALSRPAHVSHQQHIARKPPKNCVAEAGRSFLEDVCNFGRVRNQLNLRNAATPSGSEARKPGRQPGSRQPLLKSVSLSNSWQGRLSCPNVSNPQLISRPQIERPIRSYPAEALCRARLFLNAPAETLIVRPLHSLPWPAF
jgi:hypothetical protein